MKKCYIIAGGDFDGFFDTLGPKDLVIAADRGYDHCISANIKPDMIIGDFDSTKAPDLTNVIKLNPIKDETDTLAAMMLAKDKGYRQIIIYGGLGGRQSHTISNIRNALKYKKMGIDVSLKAKGKHIFIIDKAFSYQFEDQEDFYVSIFALSEYIRGLTIKGLSYELENYDMAISDSLGVSNETCGQDFYINLDKGYALVIFEAK